jgi:hypothetical protein
MAAIFSARAAIIWAMGCLDLSVGLPAYELSAPLNALANIAAAIA